MTEASTFTTAPTAAPTQQDVRDILYPARELAKERQAAELAKQREEQDRMRQLERFKLQFQTPESPVSNPNDLYSSLNALQRPSGAPPMPTSLSSQNIQQFSQSGYGNPQINQQNPQLMQSNSLHLLNAQMNQNGQFNQQNAADLYNSQLNQFNSQMNPQLIQSSQQLNLLNAQMNQNAQNAQFNQAGLYSSQLNNPQFPSTQNLSGSVADISQLNAQMSSASLNNQFNPSLYASLSQLNSLSGSSGNLLNQPLPTPPGSTQSPFQPSLDAQQYSSLNAQQFASFNKSVPLPAPPPSSPSAPSDIYASFSRLQGLAAPSTPPPPLSAFQSQSQLPVSTPPQPANDENDLSNRIKRLSSLQIPTDSQNLYGSNLGSFSNLSESEYYRRMEQMEPPGYSSSNSPTANVAYARHVSQTTVIPNQNDVSSSSDPWSQQSSGSGKIKTDDDFLDDEEIDFITQSNDPTHLDRDKLQFYSDRIHYKRKSSAKQKAAKIIIPLATTSGGILAGAVGGAVIGAAAGGVGAPVGAVIGAVIGGTAGASVGVAATQSSSFNKQMVPAGSHHSNKCGLCRIRLDAFSVNPSCCHHCHLLFCGSCGKRGGDGLFYCELCMRNLPSTANRQRIAY